ncbi:glycosyltransferase family 4 protein [Arthrobacter sp. KNU-44]|uniref:glycosyltransferase family 4 protein n=1 Tax=unclassified Arthrobacter TaxID=235627 RepID=UPI003F444BA9
MINVAFVLNMPTPYKTPVFQRLSERPDINLTLIYCSHSEPDREWVQSPSGLSEIFIDERVVNWRGRYIHFATGVWRELRLLRPDVVITGGYNPTHLLAFLYCLLRGARHISNTDGDYQSEARLSAVHRAIRWAVSVRTKAYIGPSDSSLRLFKSWGVDGNLLFKAPLSVDNDAFVGARVGNREFDFLFCGRLAEVKDPLFALAVSAGVAEKLNRRVKILVLGSGPLAEAVDAMADETPMIEVTRPGFVQVGEVALWFQRSRLFLFPTNWDPWGLVVNEACAAGLPVLASPEAGAARELVKHGENGYVLPKDTHLWVEAAARVLGDVQLWSAMSEYSREIVRNYTYESSAAGYEAAIRSAIGV